jgi:predicted DNA binding CopG/RHH family protein
VKPVQKFSDEYLASCRQMTTDQIVRFVEDFRRLHAGSRKRTRLISIKVPEDMLEAFKTKARLNGRRYQTQIKALMAAWLLDGKG